MRKYTDYEIEYIKNNYENLTDEEIAKHLGRTTKAIKSKRTLMKLVGESYSKISEEEKKNIINDYLNNIAVKKISEKYNRDITTIFVNLKKWGVYQTKNSIWTDVEIELLKINYPIKDWEYLFTLFPNRNKQQLMDKAFSLNIKKENYFWTKEDVEILRNGYKNNLNIKDIIVQLNFKYSEASVNAKACKLKLTNKITWTEEEIQYLINNYSNTSIEDILKVITKHNRKSIINFATKKLRLKNITVWTEEEDFFIKENYMNLNDHEIVEFLPNRTWRAVKSRRNYLGLDKIAEGFGNMCFSKDGTTFISYEEKDIYEYLKFNKNLEYLISIGNKRKGKYVFDVKDLYKENGFYKFCPDFVLECINVNNKKIKLNKPIIFEYYGLYNEKRNNKIFSKYREKTKLKDEFYKNNKDIYYIGIFPDDIKNNFEGLAKKLSLFYMENFKEIT